MNHSMFADTLREAILAAFGEFRQRNPSETPYAFALVGGSGGDRLRYAVATEQALLRVASEYDRRGYRYQAHDWEQFDNRAKLATWLRWANPDDGWVYGDFPERFGVLAALRGLLDAGQFGEEGEGIEELCTVVLDSLYSVSGWGERTGLTGGGPVVVGFTYGEDPRDFLRTATRANPYHLVRRLWVESWQAEEMGTRIERIA
jgi:hypothetical protein